MTYFYNDIENVIQGVKDDKGRTSRVNQGSAQVHGLEFELTATFRSISLIGNYTHIFSGLSPDAFENFGSIRLNYQRNRWNLNVSAVVRGQMAMVLPEQGAYLLLNSKLRFTVTKTLSLDLTARNLTNENYSTYGAQLDSGLYKNRVPNRGREILAGLTVSF